MIERHSSVAVSTPAWHAGDLGSIPRPGMSYLRCKNLALYIRDCVSLVACGSSVVEDLRQNLGKVHCPCLSEETLQTVGPFYLVPLPGK